MASPHNYFLITFFGLVALAFRQHRKSKFVDGDSADMQLGDTLDQGEYGSNTSRSNNLDSASDIDALLDTQPTDGDELLHQAMRDVQAKSKDAILNRSRYTSDNFRKYFQEELDTAEQQHWWEDDSLVADTIKDGYHHESDIDPLN